MHPALTRTRRLALLAALILGPALVAAWWAGWLAPRQTLPGRLTDYYQTYDRLWEVACDTATDGTDRRCYLQYVDVYRDRPDFAAAMVELVYHPGADGRPDPHLRFDIEPGLSFRDTRVSVVTEAGKTAVDTSDCMSNTCRRTGEAGRALLDQLRAGTALELVIDEGRDVPAVSTWPLDRIGEILDDLAAQRQTRGLP